MPVRWSSWASSNVAVTPVGRPHHGKVDRAVEAARPCQVDGVVDDDRVDIDDSLGRSHPERDARGRRHQPADVQESIG